MEHLAEEAGRKLGEMEDFQRLAQNFMDTIDLENGAVETDALEKLDAYEQKLLTSGATDTAFLLPGATAAPVPVPAAERRTLRRRRRVRAITGTCSSDWSFDFQ